ncbi:MAG: hypothetical protein MJ225_03850, partial [Bacilli bacterium]|nr:hypothetical protein [Bacilli bacterium]
MKINKNQSLINRINELNDINQLNMSMSELYVELINNPYYSSVLKNHDKNYLIKEIKKDFEIEFENNESELLFNHQLNNSIKQIDRSIYQNNPYIKNIQITKKC